MTAAADRGKLIKEDKLKQAFAYFDKDGSGGINAKEIKNTLGLGNSKSVDNKQWNKIVSEVDKDGNGEIDYKEFKAMMKKLLSWKPDDWKCIKNTIYSDKMINGYKFKTEHQEKIKIL